MVKTKFFPGEKANPDSWCVFQKWKYSLKPNVSGNGNATLYLMKSAKQVHENSLRGLE
jgi:hypothetical protein